MVLVFSPAQAQDASLCLKMAYIEPEDGIAACSLLLDDPSLKMKTRAMALVTRAFHFYSIEDYQSVGRDLDAMEGRIGENATMYQTRGKLRFEIGEFAAALGDFNRADALDPYNLEVLVGRGMTLEALGRPEDAVADFDRADEIDREIAAALRAR